MECLCSSYLQSLHPKPPALQSVGKCSLASPGAASAPEWDPAAHTGGDVRLACEGEGCVARPSLCSGPYGCTTERRSTCGSSACGSERDSSHLSKRVANALWPVVPEPFPHKLHQLPCINRVIISWSLGMHVSLEGRSRAFF